MQLALSASILPCPWVCSQLPTSLLLRCSAIFPRAWGWHRLLIFLALW